MLLHVVLEKRTRADLDQRRAELSAREKSLADAEATNERHWAESTRGAAAEASTPGLCCCIPCISFQDISSESASVTVNSCTSKFHPEKVAL